MRESVGTRLWPAELQCRDRFLEKARRTLGEPTFTAAWDEGKAITREQAMADVLPRAVS